MDEFRINKGVVIGVFLAIFLILLMFTFRLVNIKPQEVGIITDKMKHEVIEKPLYQGWHFYVSIFKDLDVYWKSTKRFPADEKASYKLPFKSKDGQKVVADLSIQYSLNSKEVFKLHTEVGPDYLEQVLMPQIRSISRIVLGMFTAEELYDGEKREKIQEIIKEKLTASLDKFPAIIIEDALLREFDFDPEYQKLIEDKKKAAQQVEVNKQLALAELENAKKKEAVAKGEKLKALQEAEAKAQSMIIEAKGKAKKIKVESDADMYAKKQNAKGNFAILKAEADGKELLTKALGGGQYVVGLEFAQNIPATMKTFVIPATEGTTNLMDLNGLTKGLFNSQLAPAGK